MGVAADGWTPAPSAPAYGISLCCKAGLELRNLPSSAPTPLQVARIQVCSFMPGSVSLQG